MRFNMVSDSMVFVMDSGIVTKSVVLAVPESMTTNWSHTNWFELGIHGI